MVTCGCSFLQAAAAAPTSLTCTAWARASSTYRTTVNSHLKPTSGASVRCSARTSGAWTRVTWRGEGSDPRRGGKTAAYTTYGAGAGGVNGAGLRGVNTASGFGIESVPPRFSSPATTRSACSPASPSPRPTPTPTAPAMPRSCAIVASALTWCTNRPPRRSHSSPSSCRSSIRISPGAACCHFWRDSQQTTSISRPSSRAHHARFCTRARRPSSPHGIPVRIRSLARRVAGAVRKAQSGLPPGAHSSASKKGTSASTAAQSCLTPTRDGWRPPRMEAARRSKSASTPSRSHHTRWPWREGGAGVAGEGGAAGGRAGRGEGEPGSGGERAGRGMAVSAEAGTAPSVIGMRGEVTSTADAQARSA
eukprot:scaffold12741_cov171-Isochrysis_galbana.AAC.2